MRPVVQEEVSEVFVVVCCGGAVDEDSTEDAVPGLNGEVGVVPGRTILSCTPGISKGISRGDWALGDAWNAIHLVRVVLANTMKVDSSTVV